MDQLVRHRQTKGAETDKPILNHRATSRLYLPQPLFWSGNHHDSGSHCSGPDVDALSVGSEINRKRIIHQRGGRG